MSFIFILSTLIIIKENKKIKAIEGISKDTRTDRSISHTSSLNPLDRIRFMIKIKDMRDTERYIINISITY